jgi:hypothetical protein
MLNASVAIAVHVRLATRSLAGIRMAWTPLLSCVITFSWLQRVLLWKM